MGRVASVVALAALGLGLGLGGGACVSLSGLSGDDSGPAPVEAGDAPVGDGGTPEAGDPCRHVTPPAAPKVDDDPTGDVGQLVFAVRAISLRGSLDGGEAQGYDLDGVCTCFPDPTTAHGGGSACTPPDGGGGGVSCDGDGGIDVALGQLLAAYPGFLATVNSNGGGPTMLLKVTQYNGRANDKQVFVGAVATNGIFDTKDCPPDVGVDSGSPPFSPTWRGCDRWTLDPAYVIPGTTEPSNYIPAYVVDHMLVIPPNEKKQINFLFGGLAFPLSSAILTAQLVALDSRLVPLSPQPDVGHAFRLDLGILAGRAFTGDTLRALASSQSVTSSGPLCGAGVELFKAVKGQFVCPSADLTRNIGLDYKDNACDSLSIAIAFEAQSALFGDVRPGADSGCASPTDPSFDALFDCTK